MSFSTNNNGKNKTFNEINITPLTDIFLVLLIIMMVIAPSFQSMNSNIEMPQINSGSALEVKNATVSITKNGEFYVNETKTTDSELENLLVKLIEDVEKKEVIVRADKMTRSSEIMKVMRAAQNAGFEKLVVAGEPLTTKEQDDLKKKSQDEEKS
ncbi:MAG: biopolymer transporter ExbD [Candidatus Gastranaerophilales bacterium]|nr:biopolymer transporter ExbD [Candidatus Gastranaerophilales bacterium]